MRDAVVVAGMRTPIGRRNGALSHIHPVDLSAHVLRSLVAEVRLDPAEIDDVMWGCVTQGGEQAGNIGRNAVLAAGWPEVVPAVTVDRQCGSSQQSVQFAAAAVIAGQSDIVVAGGVETMSRVPMGTAAGSARPHPDSVLERFGVNGFELGESAELVTAKWGFSRSQLDEYSLRSHERSAQATDSGAFGKQVAPLAGLLADEGIRPDTNLESLARLRPAFRPDGLVTAGNASQISDGAAALLITTSEIARTRGWLPLVRLHTGVVVGDDPVLMLTGPIAATPKVLAKAGLRLDDIGAFEVNEAFACVPLAWQAETGAPDGLLNPVGGAIAVGHPLGASGAILMTRLVHHMRDNGVRFGLQTMCEAGGLANATILELV